MAQAGQQSDGEEQEPTEPVTAKVTPALKEEIEEYRSERFDTRSATIRWILKQHFAPDEEKEQLRDEVERLRDEVDRLQRENTRLADSSNPLFPLTVLAFSTLYLALSAVPRFGELALVPTFAVAAATAYLGVRWLRAR